VLAALVSAVGPVVRMSGEISKSQQQIANPPGVAWIVGSVNRDIVAYVPRHGLPGETVLASRSAFFPGGKGANQAVAIARLGGGARLIGRVGADAFGADMTAFLTAEGVDVRGVSVSSAAATGVALIVVDAQSENIITVLPGANLDWPKNRAVGLDAEIFQPKRDDVVVAQLEIPLDVVASALKRARSVGAVTVLNPSPFVAEAWSLLSLTDVVVLNEIEFGRLADAAVDVLDDVSLQRAAARLFERGVTAVVVTLGEVGAVMMEPQQMQRVAAIKVVARDTTGAGDCFTGALVAEMLRGVGLVDAVRFAVRTAAVSVTRDGAASSFPKRGEF
jgi:ribokinase